MPANLSQQKVRDTFQQILHVDGGVDTTIKRVFTAGGVPTALALSTTEAEITSLRLTGEPLSLDNGGTGFRTLDEFRAALNLSPPPVATPFEHIYGGWFSLLEQTLDDPYEHKAVVFGDSIGTPLLVIEDGDTISTLIEGVYIIEVLLLVGATAGGPQQAYVWLEVNDSPVVGSLVNAVVTNSQDGQLRYSTLRHLTPDDHFRIMWSGSTSNVYLTSTSPAALPVASATARVIAARVG